MDDGREERERSTPLLHSGFEYHNRPHRDIFFTVLYSLYMIVMGGFAIYAVVDSGDNAKHLWSGDYEKDPTFCPINSTELALGLTTVEEEDAFTWMDFLKKGWPWIVGAAGGSVIVGILYLELFSRAAVIMVYATISIAVVVPAAAGIVLIVMYDKAIGGGVLIAVAFIFAVIMCLSRTYLDQVGRLIDCAADGLKYNWELFFFVIILKICLIIYLAFLSLFGIAAQSDGHFLPNPDVDFSDSACYNDKEEEVPCCEWKTKGWVRTYWIFLAILMVWNVFLVFEIKVYVISSVISEWYFKPEDAENREGSSRLALSNAFGPSFGSLCFGSLLLTAVSMIKWFLEKIKKENPQNCVMKCLVCFVDCILYTLVNITEFATVRMAITGEGFIGAGREVTDMLARNFLSTYSVWVLPPLVLGASALVSSLAVGGILASIAYIVFDHSNNPNSKLYAILLFVITFLIIFMVLVFFVTLLLNAISAVFVCFAIDRDNKQETKSSIHKVMRELPHMQHLEDNVEPKV